MSVLPYHWQQRPSSDPIISCSDIRTIRCSSTKLFLVVRTALQIREASVGLLLAYQHYLCPTVSVKWHQWANYLCYVVSSSAFETWSDVWSGEWFSSDSNNKIHTAKFWVNYYLNLLRESIWWWSQKMH